MELRHDTLGAGHKRSAFWTLVTNGSWHEGNWLIMFLKYQCRDKGAEQQNKLSVFVTSYL